jgi:head-tail adaptor
MSFGKMTTHIIIISTTSVKDSAGFTMDTDNILANLRAYKEERHGTKTWANRAAFSTATALFRFRRIPDFMVEPSMVIVCGGERYRILSVEDVKGRGMYWECLCEKTEPSGG